MSGTERLNAALDGRYKIEKQLGQGGMATVYLAKDIKHDRMVAVKVLKPELAAVLGAERFVVEIKTTAALQHPHILPLFDSGTADGFLYYVMPYIEGETLRDKLRRETQFGIDEAVRITTQVADALDYAHRHGVIHRDIKPENILLHDGRPMVADFGIALAVSAAAGGRMTETGLSLGTPHYMSPEQATADKDITARSDIYSLASMLYEMLAGQPPHMGNSAQMIIMKIIAEPVATVTQHRKSVPHHVAAALAKALEKLPADRFDSARAFADALANPALGRDWSTSQHPPGLTGIRVVGARWAPAAWVIAAAAVAVSAWTFRANRTQRGLLTTPLYLNIALPDSAPLALVGTGTLGVGRRALALSADGKTLVYAANDRGTDRLHRRALDAFASGPIAGTEGANYPLLSPDGEWVAFFVGSELRKVPVAGGDVVRLATIAEPLGADWSRDGRILVAAREGTALVWVSQTGGALAEIPNPQSLNRSSPSLLPDGRHALVQVDVGIVGTLGVVNLESGRTTVLTTSGPVDVDSLVDLATAVRGSTPRFLASGDIVYVTASGLVSAEFDPATHKVGGRVAELVGDVRRGGYGAQFTIGGDGTLVYAPGPDTDVGTLAWVDRSGVVDGLGFAAQRYGTFALSPDGGRIAALVTSAGGTAELWIYDLQRKAESKVAVRGVPWLPRWWPDGQRIVFTEMSTRAPFVKVSVRQLVESAGERDTLGIGWEFDDVGSDTLHALGKLGFGQGVWLFPLKMGERGAPIDSFSGAWGPDASPDGRWIAYTSNESGRYEVYVANAQRPGVRQKVSLAGGEEPLWSARGDELIYRWGQEWFAIAAPPIGSTLFGRPRMIFTGPFINVIERSHDIARSGARHLVLLGARQQTTTRLNVITNWNEVVRGATRR